MICANLFSRFSYEMGKSQYYPPSAPELSENRLFGMIRASTPQHSKDVIMGSVAMGMGIDLHGVDTIIHYGAPSSIEDYFQAVLKTISKLVVEEGKVEIQLTPSLLDTIKNAKLVTG